MKQSFLSNQQNELNQNIKINRRRLKTTEMYVEEFKHAMRAAGLVPPAQIIADNTLHRFNVADDRARSANGWYVLHVDKLAAGAFGCWKRGISGTWSAKKLQKITPAEKTAYTTKIEAMKQQREEGRERIQTDCRTWCTDTWAKASDATNEHPYLKKKCVNAFGLKTFKDSLLVPVLDMQGLIHGLQFIAADGTKKFKTGTNKVGHFFRIGLTKDKTIIICEGYATGASIHQATGHAVVVAFDAGNLLPVAQSIRSKYPDMKIIIAADDDSSTKGNPGLTKATEAARAVNGLLAIPTFPNNRGPKDTDLNDLSRLAGPEAVKACIEAAVLPTSANDETLSEAESGSKARSVDAEIQRLAALSIIEYDQVRTRVAKMLGIRPNILDMAVKNARKGNVNERLLFINTEPWPELIDASALLNDIAVIIRRFIVCNEEVANAAALWIAMTWFIDDVQVAPLAVITSPEKRCGKTQLLSLFGRLSSRAITASNISPAALFRTIEEWTPTLLLDEADSFIKDSEDIRGILNSGHTRDSAYVIRTVGENFIPSKFSTWGAKALASIGHLADTLMDRAVVLELRRKLPDENVESIRYAKPKQFDELRSKLARFAMDFSEEVRSARPSLPNSLNDRAQDNWEPLLAIAMTASDEWFKKGTAAALKLSDVENASQTIGIELLSDIQKIFKDKQVDRVTTTDLITALSADDEKPWKTYNKGLPITPRQLANKLKTYTIHSKTIRIGDDTAKGYEKSQFADAFSRYVPINTPTSATTSQVNNISDLDKLSAVTQLYPVADENPPNNLISKESDVVTDKSQKRGLLHIKEQAVSPNEGGTEDIIEDII